LPEPPAEVVALARQRADARAARDFAAADGLRDRIADAGWLVVDVAGGFELKPKPPYDVIASLRELPDDSEQPDTHRVTVSVLVDGWPDDVRTCIGLDAGNVDGAGDALNEFAGPRLREWHLSGAVGWSAARTALLLADTATVHIWCDLSTVLDGDAITPLADAITNDQAVVASGWRGVNVDVDDEWRSFVDAGPGDVDAVLGYLFAMRRSVAVRAGGPHPKARFYRNADMEFSFALREAQPGARIVVPSDELPVHQGRHHGYHDTDPAYRDAESAKTYNRFLQRFRGRSDLLAPRNR
jgi:hypothetical protein